MTNFNVRGQCRCHFIVKDHLGNHIDTLFCVLPTGHTGVHMDMSGGNGSQFKGRWMNRNEIMENMHKMYDNPNARSRTIGSKRVIFLPNIRVPDK